MLLNNKNTSIIAVTSGKGGVGKSFATVNLAEILTYMGYRVAVIDADAGLSNCATLLNENPSLSINDWVNGTCYLEELPQSLEAFTLVTASNEPGLNHTQILQLMNAMDQVTNYLIPFNDFIFIDTPAGAGEVTLWSLDQADIGLLLLVDEPTAIADAYRLCKYIYSIDPDYRFANIVNFSEGQQSGVNTSMQFNNVLNYFLNKQTEHFGFLPHSEKVRQLVSHQHTMLQNKSRLNELEQEFFYICHNIIGFFNKTRPHQTKLEQLI